jgi:hypothetical protein
VRNEAADILLVTVESKAGKRVTPVIKKRSRTDFAQSMTILAIGKYKKAEIIKLVVNSINIHKEISF